MPNEPNNLPETPEVKPRGFSNKKNIIIIALAGALALGGGITAVGIGAANHAERSTASGIQLAERYLSELNYTQAVIEFQRVLEIEPMNVDAYLGLAKAYIGLGDTEKALEALRQGLELTGDPSIQAMIDEILNPSVSSAPGSPSSSTGSTTSQPAAAFDNLDIPPLERSYDAEGRMESEVVFDENGYFTETEYGELYSDKGDLVGWGILYTYTDKVDENGVWRPISEHNYETGLYGNEHIVEYTYDDRGGLIKEVETETKHEIYSEDTGFRYVKSVWTTVYSNEYDSSGRLISQTGTVTVTNNGIPVPEEYYSETVTYEYHPNGNVTRTLTHGNYTSIVEYDSKGYQISRQQIRDGTIMLKTEIERDEKGRVIRSYHYSANGPDLTWTNEHTETYTYSDTGRTSNHHSVHTRNGVVFDDYTDTTVTIDEFDAQGRRSGSKFYDEDGNLTGYSTVEWDR